MLLPRKSIARPLYISFKCTLRNVLYYSSEKPGNYRFTTEHEWASPDKESANIITVGITNVAENALGDIVYVELPKTGLILKAKDTLGIVESVKGASDIFCPVEGTVTKTNQELLQKPGLINKDPFGKGWLCKIQVENSDKALANLMDEDSYLNFCRRPPVH